MPSSSKYELVTVVVGPIQTNCYLLADAASKKTLIIDPGDEAGLIIKRLEYHKFVPIAIINTHGHADHIIANGSIKKVYNIPIYIHKADSEYLTDPGLNFSESTGISATSPAADHFVKGGDIIDVGELKVKVIESPGHTPGGILLMCEDLLFTGDTLFCGDIGRTDLPGGDSEALSKSLKIFKTLPITLKTYPGHGNPCILSEEFKHNPYL